jgi:tetratricopeptide (TPR) repeat protein
MSQARESQEHGAVPDPKVYTVGMQQPIRQSLANAMRRHAAVLRRGAAADRELPDPDTLTGLLAKAVDWNVVLESEGFVDYVRGMVQLVVRQGAGESFRRRDEFIGALNRAVTSLSERGQPTADLHLAAATYYATVSNGADEREQAIQSAVNTARDPVEKLRALITLAKYYIDVSGYTEARKILDECEALALSVPEYHGLLMVDVLLTRGLATFYGNPRQALTYFRQAVDMGETLDSSREVNDTVATAHHFIGRIQALDGHYQEALTSMVEGQRRRERTEGSDRKALGFYHVRLAEILLEVGCVDSANYHLEECGRVFRALQESSTGEATLDAALARVHLLQGHISKASELIDVAVARARRDRHPRAELDYLFQRLYLSVRLGDLAGVMQALRRALPLWWSTEASSGHRFNAAAITRALRVAIILGARRLRVTRKHQQKEEVICPCRHCRDELDLRTGPTAPTRS